jgi:hypothetical protein
VAGISFRDCWFGDANVGGGTWITLYGGGLEFSGNYVSIIVGTGGTSYGFQLYSFNGFSIHANVFDGLQGVVSFASGPCTGGSVKDNAFSSIPAGSVLVNPSNADPTTVINPNAPILPGYGRLFGPTGPAGWEYSPNGTLCLWGEVNVASGTTAAVNFASVAGIGFGFPNACFQVQLSWITSVPGNTAYMTTGATTTGEARGY